MPRGTARRWGTIAGASALAHLGLFALLALPPASPSIRDYGPDFIEAALVAPVYLPTRREPSRRSPPEIRHTSPRSAPPDVATTSPSPADPGPIPGSAAEAAALGGVAETLRRRLGCARADQASLPRDERQACEDALGRGAAQVAALGQLVPTEKQAYYDAVKAARRSEGHGPGVGCHIRFGGGKPASVEVPAHGLKLGPLPCFIVPPAGMLSPEADVPNPY